MPVLRKSREESTATKLPLVESTNALPLEGFVERYIPKDALESKIQLQHQRPEEKVSRANDHSTCEEQQGTYSLEIQSSESITQPDFDACFSLIELTSSEAYKHSTVGWSRVKKRKEMKLLDMRYILVRKHSTESSAEHKEGSDVEGFLSFMVTYEDEVEVIYCYEIHLAPLIRNKGMGKRLIALYEEIGRKVGLEKAMLTVFRSNQITLRFYEKLGYEEDEFSPRPKRLRNGVVKKPDYLILSKSLQEEAVKQETGSEPSGET